MSSWNTIIRNDRKKLVAEVQEFFKDAEKAIDICSHSGLSHLAPQFMQAVIDNAGFDDYTGVLANSYTMAMVVNGKVVPQISATNRSKYMSVQVGVKLPTMWRSYDMRKKNQIVRLSKIKDFAKGYKINKKNQELNPIPNALGYYKKGKFVEEPRFVLKNRFSRRGHPAFISRTFAEYKHNFNPRGHGLTITELRSGFNGPRKGSGLVIGNAAPYAMKVHNKGSVVIPMAVGKMVEGSVVTIMKNEFNKIKMIKR